MKKIYLAENIDDVDYDECISAVIVSNTKKDAEVMANKLFPFAYSIKKVGTACASTTLGVLNASYK